jgi:hypothetical protein
MDKLALKTVAIENGQFVMEKARAQMKKLCVSMIYPKATNIESPLYLEVCAHFFAQLRQTASA